MSVEVRAARFSAERVEVKGQFRIERRLPQTADAIGDQKFDRLFVRGEARFNQHIDRFEGGQRTQRGQVLFGLFFFDQHDFRNWLGFNIDLFVSECRVLRFVNFGDEFFKVGFGVGGGAKIADVFDECQ